MLADYHVHSIFSDDSFYPMEEVCRDAVRLNLDEICFTDHVDYGVKPDHDAPDGARIENGLPVTNVDYRHYFPEVARVQEEFADELVVRCGMEFGVQVHTEPQFDRLYEAHKEQWDFLILSIHQVADLEFWMGDFQEGRTQKEYNDAYYQELYDVVRSFDHYSVLGHLDLIKRYDPAGAYPFEATRDIVAAILERVIASGKGIEVNTSSFRYGLADLQPCTEILRLYHDLGGRIVTIGSDSHKPAHLGAYIRLVQRRLAALGYTEFCTFDHMEPTFHPLEA
ncbi:MAG: histidinol-phosphatase HisJ family protein [Atopobiaceae bacterium]|jgi:histidinol-phosphatase (PHP family)|nr:histidinol-phosphatase HisJ family protein [Atopobiaceae bacterium]MCH4214252.1 histidinol-phosphatase HisJ family protein [Atopobiaceae bacterium]MCH4229451.1 histidinol-phosphatase HisJ family protein [Atopobiaceae bacterium]MCH4276077.1 histidinol-phosphatase HisJ family protein [Atopobiaceae bacterium]MCI1226575.1 histidinol-phosphatase HisJ family protein [Atopobiaceae bacterium]